MLTSGMERVGAVIDGIRARGERTIGGAEVFRLYDSYGIPVDLIAEMAEEEGLALDREGFEEAMKGQRQKARAKSKFKLVDRPLMRVGGLPELDRLPPTPFEGYENTSVEARVLGTAKLVNSTDAQYTLENSSLRAGDEGYVVLDRTPFYLQSGGQISDVGTLAGPDVSAAVEDVELFLPSGPRV